MKCVTHILLIKFRVLFYIALLYKPDQNSFQNNVDQFTDNRASFDNILRQTNLHFSCYSFAHRNVILFPPLLDLSQP